jgi:hypothetical protein
MMFSLTRNIMIRRGIFPRIEGVRLYFINNLRLGFFSALAASSNLFAHGYPLGAANV